MTLAVTIEVGQLLSYAFTSCSSLCPRSHISLHLMHRYVDDLHSTLSPYIPDIVRYTCAMLRTHVACYNST